MSKAKVGDRKSLAGPELVQASGLIRELKLKVAKSEAEGLYCRMIEAVSMTILRPPIGHIDHGHVYA